MTRASGEIIRAEFSTPTGSLQRYSLTAFRASFATMTAIAALLALPRPAFAAPQGGSVVAGSATISVSGTTTNINQSTNSAIINWMSFSIAPKETVNFNQPNSTSVTLNRVIGYEESIIAGALNANGQVFIVNSAGVVFTKGAQVNVGGIVGSTLDISNANFMAGNYTFSGASTASVVNNGHITAAPGGYVSLLGNTVSNNGVISARLGTVTLASGQQMTLNFGGNSLVDVTIDKGTYNALVANKGLIKADGGKVIMTAKAADAVLSAQVNNSGIIQARTIGALLGGGNGGGTRGARRRGTMQIGAIKQARAGSGMHVGAITLIADGGTVNVSGTLDASAPKGGQGGTIETSGNTVKIADSAIITTKAANGQNGNWIIDPDGFTIAATGGDITGATLSSELASDNITILSTQGSGNGGLNDGNINVNDTVTWSANTTLTLTATNAIYVNAVITGSGASSGLTLNAGTNINVDAPSSLQVATLTATAVGNVDINAAQTWANAGVWTFNGSNINVNDTVNWSNGTLTFDACCAVSHLDAQNNLVLDKGSYININAAMTASANAQFVAIYDTRMDTSTTSVYDPNIDVTSTVASSTYGTPFGGFNFLFDNTSWSFTGRLDFTNNTAVQPLTINTHQYSLITNMTQLAAISSGTGYYALASDVNASGTTYSSAVIPTLAGTLEGLGHAIDNLTINSTASNAQDIGLIGGVNGGSIVRDISLANASLTAKGSYIGTLVGQNKGMIINANADGTLNVTAATGGNAGGWNGSEYIGGLVGANQGIIFGSQANVAVTTIDSINVGGFVGNNVAFHFGQAIILNSASYGAVSVTITNQNAASFQENNDTGFGGFVGSNEGGVISNSSSSGSVTAQTSGSGVFISSVGGFVGDNDSSPYNSNPPGVINNSVSTSAVTGDANTSNIGGFVGITNVNFGGSFINNSSAFGSVQAPLSNNVGGFDGQNYGTFNGDIYNPNTTGQQSGSSYNNNGPDASTTNATGPSPTQGPPSSNAAQTAATARSEAQTLTQAAIAQQAAVAQAAANAAAQVTANVRNAAQGANASMGLTQVTATNPPDPVAATTAGTREITALGGPKIDDAILNTPPATTPLPTTEQRQRRRVANTTPPRRATGNGGGGAAIRSIEINGQRYRLER